jgi:hypothetical protein
MALVVLVRRVRVVSATCLCRRAPRGFFKVERYTRLWERNPFAALAPIAPHVQPSPFKLLFLESWLKDGDNEVIYVENSETLKRR